MKTFPIFPLVWTVVEPFAKGFEGFRATPYKDSAKGVPTIGWGTTVYPNGKAVSLSDGPCTEAEATEWMKQHMFQDYEKMLGKLSYSATVNEMAAMLDFIYNLGFGPWANSTLLRRFNSGDLKAAGENFLLWDKAHVDGVLTEVAGLARRRKAEKGLFERRENG